MSSDHSRWGRPLLFEPSIIDLFGIYQNPSLQRLKWLGKSSSEAIQREFTELGVDDARAHLRGVDLGVSHSAAAVHQPGDDWKHHHRDDERTITSTVGPRHRDQLHNTNAVACTSRFARLSEQRDSIELTR